MQRPRHAHRPGRSQYRFQSRQAKLCANQTCAADQFNQILVNPPLLEKPLEKRWRSTLFYEFLPQAQMCYPLPIVESTCCSPTPMQFRHRVNDHAGNS